MPGRSGPTRVVIIGAGFAGISAARELAGTSIEVTLLDARNFHTFQALLYEVATAGLNPSDIAFPVRAMFQRAPNITFRRGRVVRIDTAVRTVELESGATIPYDTLIVATGVTASYFSIPGAEDNTWPLYTLKDARALREELLRRLEASDDTPGQREAIVLHLVIIGGGATGVEVAGAVVELLDISVKHDRVPIDRVRSKVVLVDAADRLLTAFGDRSSRYALDELSRRGIEVRLGVAVDAVTPDAVHLADGTDLAADVVIWAAGITASGTIAASLPGERGPGSRVVVGEDLALPGFPDVYVVGDAAAVPFGPRTKGLAPQLAQTAIQSGRHAARAVLARSEGGSTRPFSYRDKGIMATIGRRAAVAELAGRWPLRGRVLKGSLGWLAWLGLHLVYLVGVRNRVVVLLNWFWRYVGWSSGPRIVIEDESP